MTLYSIDLSENVIIDNTKKTGYLYDSFLKSRLQNVDGQKTILGKTIAHEIDAIGSDIDMVIIDTTHEMPGEILDFLVVLPYMSKRGVVVLHDVGLNYSRTAGHNPSNIHVRNSDNAVCTKILFNSVTAKEKYLNFDGEHYPNIAAFTVCQETMENILDVFNILTMTWCYDVEADMAMAYRNILAKHYDDAMLKLFDFAIYSNSIMRSKIERRWEEYEAANRFLNIVKFVGLPVYLGHLQDEEKQIIKSYLEQNEIDIAEENFNMKNKMTVLRNVGKESEEKEMFEIVIQDNAISGIKGWLHDKSRNFI